jgi:hypothetical protein
MVQGASVWCESSRAEQLLSENALRQLVREGPAANEKAHAEEKAGAQSMWLRGLRVDHSVSVAKSAIVQLLRWLRGRGDEVREGRVREATKAAHFGLNRLFTDQFFRSAPADEKQVGPIPVQPPPPAPTSLPPHTAACGLPQQPAASHSSLRPPTAACGLPQQPVSSHSTLRPPIAACGLPQHAY